MSSYLAETNTKILVDLASPELAGQVAAQLSDILSVGESPVRFAVTESHGGRWSCEVGSLSGSQLTESIFHRKRRARGGDGSFNVVMLVPTGIGAEIGGHAGDATPAAILLASVCDTLVTHPNVLNASDIIQVPPNTLYVEGSVISRLLMGTVGLRRARANRLLVVVQDHHDRLFKSAAYNAVNAARATYGLQVRDIVDIDPAFRMVAEHSASGTATGQVYGLEHLWSALDRYSGDYDAVAINSVIEVPSHFHWDYYKLQGAMVNPWGGVEAMLTHAVSLKYGVPAAHAPMFESREISEMDLDVVDSRMAAETISLTFLQSVLRGLQHAPRLSSVSMMDSATALTAEDIACVVMPDGCLGIPTIAALEQGILVVAVRENANIMRNDLSVLPWKSGQYLQVDNYWEAAGLLAALRAGLDPRSVRRPLNSIGLETENSLESVNNNRPHGARTNEMSASAIERHP